MKVFVYGSLMSGFSNHDLLAHSRALGDAATAARYKLISLGAFPGMLDGGETSVLGELYEVDDATLARLDRLEGHPNFYRRAVIQLDDGSHAAGYLLPSTGRAGAPYADRNAIPSGSWGEHARDARRKVSL